MHNLAHRKGLFVFKLERVVCTLAWKGLLSSCSWYEYVVCRLCLFGMRRKFSGNVIVDGGLLLTGI